LIDGEEHHELCAVSVYGGFESINEREPTDILREDH